MDKKITPRMRKAISVIETITGGSFRGKTFDEACKFIGENKPKCEGKDVRDYCEPSEKMKRAISWIEDTLDVKFEGVTMKEASQFISEFIDEAKEKSKETGYADRSRRRNNFKRY